MRLFFDILSRERKLEDFLMKFEVVSEACDQAV